MVGESETVIAELESVLVDFGSFFVAHEWKDEIVEYEAVIVIVLE